MRHQERTEAIPPDEVRTIVASTVRTHGRRHAHGRPNGPSRESTAPEHARTREIPEPDAGVSRAEDAPDDGRPAERLLESKLDQLTKSRWIG